MILYIYMFIWCWNQRNFEKNIFWLQNKNFLQSGWKCRYAPFWERIRQVAPLGPQTPETSVPA